MHSRRLHLQSRQFLQRFLRQNPGLHAQQLSQLHRRPLQHSQFSRTRREACCWKRDLPLRPLAFSQQEVLGLIPHVAAHQTEAEFSEPKTSRHRAALFAVVHQSQPPFFNT